MRIKANRQLTTIIIFAERLYIRSKLTIAESMVIKAQQSKSRGPSAEKLAEMCENLMRLVGQITSVTRFIYNQTGDEEFVLAVSDRFSMMSFRIDKFSLDIQFHVKPSADPSLIETLRRSIDQDEEAAERKMLDHMPADNKNVMDYLDGTDKLVQDVIRESSKYANANPKQKGESLADALGTLAYVLKSNAEELDELVNPSGGFGFM